MAISRYTRRSPAYSPVRDWEDVASRLSRFFDDSPLSTGSTLGAWSPKVNITETSDELVLTAELPGLKEEDVHVEVENNVLSVSGEKSEERSEGDEERKYHLWERSYGSFQRSFTLPRSVQADAITAGYDGGVLTVRLPKVAEAKGRKIEISKN
jgi:HSP20 family protein